MPPKQEKSRFGSTSGSSKSERTESTRSSKGTFVGKFTTSVKKFIQDVESDHTREGTVQINQRLRLVDTKVGESYTTIKKSLTTLHQQYEQSKAERNILRRYSLFKTMIKAVIKLDTQYWVLIEIPKQEKQEPVNTYVMRCCSVIEKSTNSRIDGKSQTSKQVEDELKEKERKRLDSMSISEIEEENKQLVNDVFKLMKKYNNLRNVVHELKVSYMDAKLYPFLPRYIMLKDMIKGVLRDPTYVELYHEDLLANT